jgi:hypothetical protein
MEDRTLEIVLDALAKEIRSLKTDLMLKDMEMCKLREENMHLRANVYGVEEGEENDCV